MVPLLGWDARPVAHVARCPCLPRRGLAVTAACHDCPAARAWLRAATQATARGGAALAGFLLPPLHKGEQPCHPGHLGSFPTRLLPLIQGFSPCMSI